MRRAVDLRLLTGTVGGLGFAALGLLVATGWLGLTELDATLGDRIHRYSAGHPDWLTAMRWLTQLGSSWVLLAVTATAVVICRRREQPRAAMLCIAAAVLIPLSTQLVKTLTARPRPAGQFWSATGFAFPSGHTSSATATAAIVLIVCWPLVRDRRAGARTALVALAVAVPLTIGFSRLAGGVHWPSDVLGGWLLGVAGTSLLAGVSGRVATRSGR